MRSRDISRIVVRGGRKILENHSQSGAPRVRNVNIHVAVYVLVHGAKECYPPEDYDAFSLFLVRHCSSTYTCRSSLCPCICLTSDTEDETLMYVSKNIIAN